jgi:hypothetical protein
MREKPNRSAGFTRLKLLLILATSILFGQLLLPKCLATLQYISTSNSIQPVLLFTNVCIVFILIAIKFSPPLYSHWRDRSRRAAAERSRQEELRQSSEQRKLYERMRDARRRQVI